MTGPKLRMVATFPVVLITLVAFIDAFAHRHGSEGWIAFGVAIVGGILWGYCTQTDDELDWMLSRNEWKVEKARRQAARKLAKQIADQRVNNLKNGEPECSPNCGTRGMGF